MVNGMRSRPPMQLILCEQYNELRHGVVTNTPNERIQQHFIVLGKFNAVTKQPVVDDDLYDNVPNNENDSSAAVADDDNNNIFSVAQELHLNPEIAVCYQIPMVVDNSMSYVTNTSIFYYTCAVLKTCWLRIFQRHCRRVLLQQRQRE